MNQQIKRMIKVLGGTQASAAEKLGISQASVSRMLANIDKPSPALSKEIETMTNGEVTRVQLRPDIFA